MKVKRGGALDSARRRARSVLLAAAALAILIARSSSAQQPTPPSKKSPSSSLSSASLFSDPDGARNLVVVGRYLAADEARLPLAATFLARGAARLRAAGTPDPLAEVVLGETAERLASRAGAAPEGVTFLSPFDPRLGRTVRVYDGTAFRRALDDVPREAEGPLLEIRERALAGALRCRFAIPGVTLVARWEETVAWLTFAESVETDAVADGVARRLERSAPELARLLLASGRMEDLSALDRRLTDASERLEALEPDPAKARRLAAAARAVRTLRGTGDPPFPQEVWLTHGPGAAVARIEGRIGALELVVASAPDAPPAARTRRILHEPLLPVPGSLAVTPDRKAVTWLEAETPTRVTRVAYALDGSGPRPIPKAPRRRRR